MNFNNKLRKIVEDLRNNPQFKVAHFKIFDADENLIQKVEKSLGYKLDKSITDFYKSCNGIQLMWLDDYNEDFDDIENEIKNSNLNDEFFIAQNNNFEPDGCIWIPSIEKVFLSNPYGNFDFDTNKLNPQITNHSKNLKLRLLDWFSAYNDISFLLNETSSPYLIMGKDHHILNLILSHLNFI